MVDFVVNLIVFVLSLALLIVIHEFGHYITSKMFNVYVTEFSIGFGPSLFSKKKEGKETTFSIRAVPLGGYCAIVGESLPEFTEEEYNALSPKDKELVDLYKTLPPERKLDGIAKWKRAIVMLAGVTLNFLLGFILLVVFFTTNAFPTMYDNIVQVTPDSIAEKSGLTSADVIISSKYEITINGQKIEKTYDSSDLTGEFYNSIVVLSSNQPQTESDTAFYTLITSENKTINFTLTPVKNNEGKLYWPTIGITFQSNTKTHTYHYNFGEAIVHSGETFGEYSIAIFKALGSLFTKEGLENVGGMIAIFGTQQQMMNMGFTYVINLWALISINLGIMNLLPFPGLDGWHFLVIIVEGITRRELPKKFKNIMANVGMLLLFGLMILVTLKDIISLF